MKWLALSVIVLSSFSVSISCSGGEDSVNIGDRCGSSVCQSGVLYFCGTTGRLDKYADCNSVCDIMDLADDDWEFAGTCSDKYKSGDYMECCDCRSTATSDTFCVNSQPNGL